MMYVKVLCTTVYMFSLVRIMMLEFNAIDIIIVLSGNYIVAKANSKLIVLI